MSINAPGIGSGLDIEGLVQRLLAAEGTPAKLRLDQREARLQSRLSAFGQFRSALDQVRSALSGLKSQSTFAGRSVTVANESLLTASADSTAATGSHAIEVVRLAQAHKLASVTPVAATTTAIGHGTLTIDVGGSAFSVTISEGANTLADIRSAINSAGDNTGVNATLVTANDGVRLVLTGTATGAVNEITVTESGGDGGLSVLVYDPDNLVTNLTPLQVAQDARIEIDTYVHDSADNVITEAISGLTLTLKSAAVGTTTTLTVGTDAAASRKLVSDFVQAYNAALKTLQALGKYNAADKTAGPLLGDATLRGLMNSLRTEAVKSLAGNGDFSDLSEIGVTTATDGTLVLNGTKLDAVLASGFDQVGLLFSTATTGVAHRLDSLLATYVGTDGLIQARTDGIQTGVKDITAAREVLAQRLVQVELRLRAQFTALDTLVSQFRSTGDFLTQQLETLNPVFLRGQR